MTNLMNRVRSMPFMGALRDAGAEVFFVGGCVRDRMMGLPSKDVDLLARGLPYDRLATVLEPHGSVNLVGKSFGVLKFHPRGRDLELDLALPRVERSTGSGHRDFEVVTDHEGSVERDLERRDFTFNAMAMSALSGALMDPFGGARDLKAELVRMVHEESFSDDPLRMLRAVQFAARFGFSLDPRTEAAMRSQAPLAASLSGERVAGELVKLLRAERPSDGFRMMLRTGLLEVVLPEVHALVGVKQPRKHHRFDAFDHVMTVVDAARSDDALDEPGNMNLMLAALCHDLGKPPTFTEEEPGKIHFHGHQHVSKSLTRKLFERVPFHAVDPTVDRERVLRDVKLHMDLATSPDEREKMTPRAMRRLLVRAGGPEGMNGLIDLRIADKRGGARPDNIRWILEFRDFVSEFVERKEPFNLKMLAVNGKDVMEALQCEPGPVVGRVLNNLFERVVEGGVENTRDALLPLVHEAAEATKDCGTKGA